MLKTFVIIRDFVSLSLRRSLYRVFIVTGASMMLIKLNTNWVTDLWFAVIPNILIYGLRIRRGWLNNHMQFNSDLASHRYLSNIMKSHVFGIAGKITKDKSSILIGEFLIT